MFNRNLIKTLFIAILIFTGSNAFAQNDGTRPKRTPEEIAQKRADKMNEKLQLSSDQYKSVYNLFLENAQWRQQNMQSFGGDKEAMKKAFKERHLQNKEQLKNILSSEQITKLKEIRKENKGKHKGWDKNKGKHKGWNKGKKNGQKFNQ